MSASQLKQPRPSAPNASFISNQEEAEAIERSVKDMDSASRRSSTSSSASDRTTGSTIWDARAARMSAEEEAEQKLIDAVIATSLLEYKEKERALDSYELDLVHQHQTHELDTMRVQGDQYAAGQRKREAMQSVIDNKNRAHEMQTKARAAAALYTQRSGEWANHQAEMDMQRLSEERDQAMRVVDAQRQEAARTREEKEREAEQKLIDAVCAASLLEHKEKERAMDEYELDLVRKYTEHESGAQRLQNDKQSAGVRMHGAMQTVIESKMKAHEMQAKARDAVAMYEQHNAKRIEKQGELEQMQQRDEQERALREVQERKQEAIRKREEAERRAQEARDKAAAMRLKAVEAAKVVRGVSRRQIETELDHEEQQRQLEYENRLQQVELEKKQAKLRRETALQKAEEAKRRAEELRARADAARQLLDQSSSKQHQPADSGVGL